MATEAHSIEDVINGIKESTYEVQTESRLAYSGLKKGGRARLFRGLRHCRARRRDDPLLQRARPNRGRARLREAQQAGGSRIGCGTLLDLGPEESREVHDAPIDP
jgi:hypothetical protein